MNIDPEDFIDEDDEGENIYPEINHTDEDWEADAYGGMELYND